MPAGYSGTPLAQKLGIKPGARVVVRDAPMDYAKLVAPVPDGVKFAKAVDATVDVVHVFTKEAAKLKAALAELRTALRPDAALWVSWPKRASKIATDVTEDRIRDLALPIGFVDIKVCAVDATWSGLKLVIRKDLRRAPQIG